MSKIIQIGFAKSGNYWLYKIIEEIVNRDEDHSKSFVKNQKIYKRAKNWDLSYSDQADIDVIDITSDGLYWRISSRYREKISDWDSYFNNINHVWTHSYFKPRSHSIIDQFDKSVYIIRDPRDVAISLSRFAFTSYYENHYSHNETSPDEFLANRLQGLMLNWVKHVIGYLRYKTELDIHVIFYENLNEDPINEIRRLSKYLDERLSNEKLLNIVENVSFETMKAKNREHLRRGTFYQWKNILSESQIKIVDKIAGSLLDFLGYPCTVKEYGFPTLPKHIDEERLTTILEESRGDILDKMMMALSLIRSRRPLVEKIRKGVDFLLDKKQ